MNDESWILDSAKKLGERHYSKNEIELFLLMIEEIRNYEGNEKKHAIVAYYNGIRSWANNSGTKQNLIKILKTQLKWEIVADEISGNGASTTGKEIFWNVIKEDKKFIGREKELKEIEQHLTNSNVVVITAFVGLGGIGKTTLTSAYVWKNKDKYKTIVWFNTNADEKLLKEEYLRFGIEKNITREENNEIGKVKEWFEENTNWLIIFDNVENEDSLNEFMPNRGGKIIITSRNRFWNNIVNKIELETYSMKEIKVYLSKWLKNQYEEVMEEFDGEKTIEKFAQDLGFHPLAVTHAVSYISNADIGIDEYLDYKENQKEIILSKFTPEQIDNHEFLKSYIKVFESVMLSVKKIYMVNKEAIACLNKCAFLVPEKIPKSLFPIGALLKLSEFSLITFQRKYISIHRLVQESIRFKMAGNSTGDDDDKIYPSIPTLETELFLTYDLMDLNYPIGKCTKDDVLFKRDLLPHYGSLFSFYLKQFKTNISSEQTKKLTQIELEEIDESFEKFRGKFSNLGNFEIYENNFVASAKKALQGEISKKKVNDEELLKVLSSCLEVFEKELIPDEETIAETNLHLAFYNIRKYLKNRNLEDSLKLAMEFHIAAQKGKFDENQINYTYLLEANGFFKGNANDKKEQLVLYIESYRKQMDFLQRDFSEEMPSVKWEQHKRSYNLDKTVSAGRFIFPGFKFYQGEGFSDDTFELEVFIGRGQVDGNIIPGKFMRFPKFPFDGFQCSYKGEEYKVEEGYELLKMEPGTYKWVLSSFGEKVNKAIQGGFENGQPLYIGRVFVIVEDDDRKIPTEPSVGKINELYQGCIVPLWNKEYLFTEYEILVGV